LNVALTKSKFKEDEKTRKYINNILNKVLQEEIKFEKLDTHLMILNEDIRLIKIKNSEKREHLRKIRSKTHNDEKMHGNMKNLLFRVSDNETNSNIYYSSLILI